ncbi:MAG TPA: hypothetical protein VM537_29420, partial [Anaerolineae bacterium]|nr:hypothetical protein [Anaerolineae bacterium]
MPRDSNGLYSLPAGNPVAAGTIITIAWANPTMSDIGTSLTDSLDRYGRGGMLAPLKLTAGTSVAPGLSWSTELNSGLYLEGVNDLRFAVGGDDVTRWDGSGFSIWNGAEWEVITPLTVGDGTVDGQMLIWQTDSWVPTSSLTIDGAGNAICTGEITAVTYNGDGSALTGIQSVNGVPVGGTTGQVLVKDSNGDFDTSWAAPGAAPVDSVFTRTGAVVAQVGDYSGFYLGLTAQASDSALLGGENAAHYHNAANLSSGTLLAARLTGTYNISISGTAANATTATNSLALNGQNSAFYQNAANLTIGVLPLARLSGTYPCNI